MRTGLSLKRPFPQEIPAGGHWNDGVGGGLVLALGAVHLKDEAGNLVMAMDREVDIALVNELAAQPVKDEVVYRPASLGEAVGVVEVDLIYPALEAEPFDRFVKRSLDVRIYLEGLGG
jgi:hypothetical protein